jgi:hypothetical protein
MLFPRSYSNSVAIVVRPADETARLGFVRDGPAEINFHFDDLTFPHGHDFGVTEFLAGRLATLIGHEDSVAVGNEVFILETVDPLAVWPATRKICRAINSVIERTREMKVRGNQFLNASTILLNVGLLRRARDFDALADVGHLFHSGFHLFLPALYLLFRTTGTQAT